MDIETAVGLIERINALGLTPEQETKLIDMVLAELSPLQPINNPLMAPLSPNVVALSAAMRIRPSTGRKSLSQSVLDYLEVRHDARTAREITSVVGADMSTVSSTLAALVKKGLVVAEWATFDPGRSSRPPRNGPANNMRVYRIAEKPVE